MLNISNKILRRIRAKQRGWVFTPKDFLDIGSRAAIDKNLSRLTSKGIIRRLSRGIYDFPKVHKKFGIMSPDNDQLAQAVASQTGNKAFPSGAMAANIVGLSTQVPARAIYLTNGPSRSKQIGNKNITLQHSRLHIFDNAPKSVNLLLQALYNIGKNHIDDKVIRHCSRLLNNKDKSALNSVVSGVPSWMVGIIHKIQTGSHG